MLRYVERSLRLIENATSLGGVVSTLEARARWEGRRVPPRLLRLSVGLEHVEDLWSDGLVAGARLVASWLWRPPWRAML
jgi:cystathionine beta-lyase/cystathionine gamma-synthase